MRISGRTHVGLVRERNEDSFYLGTYLAVVADGMGGHPAGDVASATVVDAMRGFDQPVSPGQVATLLAQAIAATNAAMRSKIRERPEVTGMGSTLVAIAWSEQSAVVANLGDSRAYLLRDGQLTRLTEDHTYEHVLANAAKVPRLPAKIARFLDGRVDGRSPDLRPIDLLPGDRVLLCSDGLSSFVDHDVIASALAKDQSPDAAADRLVAIALEAGGRDNITVVIASA